MGFWINNFQEFERKQKGENRLVLNFYYVPVREVGMEPEELEKPRKVKIFSKHKIKIPTGFIFPEPKVQEIIDQIKENPAFSGFEISRKRVGKYSIVAVSLPYNRELINQLPKAFEKGDYDKMLRLAGFFPERKAEFSGELEKLIEGKEEVELDSLEGISFGEFPTQEDMDSSPWLYIDIEKPLWKSDSEKRNLKARKKLLRLDKKLKNTDGKHELRQRAIRKLEEWLTIDIEGVGKVGLWDEKADAAVSFIATTWRNCGTPEKKELFVLDPKNELDYTSYRGHEIYKFKTEKELLEDFILKVRERKPLLCSGHNVVYDETQIRFASNNNKLKYNPAVSGVNPRRDFVRDFFQRLKEDLFYIDTLWLNGIFFPWLKQKRFSNLKLQTVSEFHGIDFKKSMTHEELREVELQRLAGSTEEIRREAGRRMMEYAAGDVDPVVRMIDKNHFIPLAIKMKQALPFCTLTEIAFHPNCATKYHDYKHFQRAGNHRYYHHRQRTREDEIQIFKKRFPSHKRKMLDWAGIEKEKATQGKVYEIYLPFEEWIKNPIFRFAPEFRQIYDHLHEKERIPFLQYLKALERDILVDYYFVRRDSKVALETERRNNLGTVLGAIEKETFDKYYGSFKYLKQNFRSIYDALNGEGRAMIRPGKKNASSLEEIIPQIMHGEIDLFLLRERAEAIEKMLTPAKRRNLSAFLTNFKTLEKLEREVQKILSEKGIEGDARELLYTSCLMVKKLENERVFASKYGFDVSELTSIIAQSYRNLAQELKTYNARVIEINGDYLFVQADESIKESRIFYTVRELDSIGSL